MDQPSESDVTETNIHTFIPANKIEKMKIERLTKRNNVTNAYTTKVTNGKNNIFFFLGQKFSTIISMMVLLFFSVGIVKSKNLPPSPKPLEEGKYRPPDGHTGEIFNNVDNIYP